MGKKMAPATKNPHSPAAKQVKMCVNHAAMQDRPSMYPMSISSEGHVRQIVIAQIGGFLCDDLSLLA